MSCNSCNRAATAPSSLLIPESILRSVGRCAVRLIQHQVCTMLFVIHLYTLLGAVAVLLQLLQLCCSYTTIHLLIYYYMSLIYYDISYILCFIYYYTSTYILLYVSYILRHIYIYCALYTTIHLLIYYYMSLIYYTIHLLYIDLYRA
jgi:hypothetical protein